MKIIFLDFKSDKIIFENERVDLPDAILLPKEGEYVHLDDVMYLVKTVHYKYSITTDGYLYLDNILINIELA